MQKIWISSSASHHYGSSATAGDTFHSTFVSHRPDVHEMDHTGILDSELNHYLCCSALWSLLMTSRWPSSIFKTLSVHKGSSGNEVLVTGINEISLCRLVRGSQRGSPPDTLTYCMWSNGKNTWKNPDDVQCLTKCSHINHTYFSQCGIKLME